MNADRSFLFSIFEVYCKMHLFDEEMYLTPALIWTLYDLLVQKKKVSEIITSYPPAISCKQFISNNNNILSVIIASITQLCLNISKPKW